MATNTTIKAKQTPAKRKKVYKSGNFFTAPVVVGEKYVTIRLPTKAAQYLELNKTKTVFWSPVNGVIQVSAHEPSIVIPMMNVNTAGFRPQ